MKIYILKLKKELEELEKYPFAFKGVLSDYEFESYSEKEVTKMLFKEGVYLKTNTEHEYIRKINPILHYEFFAFSKRFMLYEIIDELNEYIEYLNNTLKFRLDITKYSRKLKNKIVKRIYKSNEYQELYDFYNYEEGYYYLEKGTNKKFIFNNFYEAIARIIYFPKKDFEYILEEFVTGYLVGDDVLAPFNSISHYEWLEFELSMHKLELIKIYFNNLNNPNKLNNFINPTDTSIEDKYSYLDEKDQKFLIGISSILIDKNNISIFEKIIQLKEEKNKPFFAAIYTYFSNKKGEGKKLFYITKPKPYYDIIKDCYDIDMGYIPETGGRPDDLKEIFEDIYLKKQEKKND